MKKLIFCFDGTSNDPSDAGDFCDDSSISNVLKLHILFGGSLRQGASAGIGGQRGFYYSGIGTHGGKVRQMVNAMFAPPHGDLDDILDEAKANLRQNHEVGDEIFIFGFSRGAAIARMFAASPQVKQRGVKFLGVFDTVAAIIGEGLDLRQSTLPASSVLFENGTIGAHVQRAVHLLSVDEQRLAFQPTLINRDAANPDRVQEVWFAGVHSDIGGGYWFDGLSDIALQFMLERAREHGLQYLECDQVNYANLTNAALTDDDAEKICLDDLMIRPLAHGKLHAQQRGMMAKKATLKPRLVRVNVDDAPSAEHLPVLHHSLIERFQKVANYRPYALRDLKFRVLQKDGSVGAVIHGIAEIPQKVEKDGQ